MRRVLFGSNKASSLAAKSAMKLTLLWALFRFIVISFTTRDKRRRQNSEAESLIKFAVEKVCFIAKAFTLLQMICVNLQAILSVLQVRLRRMKIKNHFSLSLTVWVYRWRFQCLCTHIDCARKSKALPCISFETFPSVCFFVSLLFFLFHLHSNFHYVFINFWKATTH